MSSRVPVCHGSAVPRFNYATCIRTPVNWSTSLLWISGYEKESQGKKSLEEIMSQSLTKYDNYTNLKTPKQNQKKSLKSKGWGSTCSTISYTLFEFKSKKYCTP